jgi:peptide/nickel transport system substrate-binding protein
MKLKTIATAGLLATMLSPFGAYAAGTLTIGLSSDVNTLDPHMTASIASDLSVLSHIYPALIRRGPDLKLVSDLATSWQIVDDNTWRFKLTPDAKFANGEKLDAEAVRWNFERVRDPKLNSRIKAWFGLIKDVVVVDPTTIDIKTSESYPALADQMSMFFLLPPKWANETNPATATASGGQYQMSERVPGSRIVLEANPSYWGEKPKFDKVVFQVIPEDAARSASLVTGEIDFTTKIPVTEVERLKSGGKVDAGAIPSARTAFLKINARKPPLNNKLFRQALNYAVDKEGITSALFHNLAEVSTCQVMSKDYFGYNPDLKPYPYDPDKAIELLQESGVDLSQQIELELPVGVYVQADEVTQAVASQFEAVGLNVKITELSFGSFMDKYLKAHDLAQLAFLTNSWPTLDADGMLSLFQPGNVYDFWDNDSFGTLVKAGRSSTDPNKRIESYKKATELMCEEAPVVYLYNQPVTYGVSSKLVWHARGDDWVRAGDFDQK